MRSLFAIALLLLAGANARAETFSFVIDGQAIRIGIQDGCNDLSCVSIDVPGYYSSDRGSSERRRASRTQASKHREPNREAKRAKAKPAAPATAAPQPPASHAAALPAPQPASPTTAPAQAAEPAPRPSPKPAEASVAAEPKVADARPAKIVPSTADNAAAPAPADKAPAVASEQRSTVIAALPPAKPEAAAPARPQAIGMWNGRDGQIRIEPCGQFLCGYAGGGSHAGKMVLINMRQTKPNHWAGRVRDFQSGGVYSASMWLRGDNSLRIQGCAFGGMICDGRTLARVN